MWIFTDKKGWEYKPYDQVEKRIEEKSELVVKKTRSRKKKEQMRFIDYDWSQSLNDWTVDELERLISICMQLISLKRSYGNRKICSPLLD